MKYINLNGTTVPALGLGTAAMRGKTCEKALTYALELGYRHIDTAAFYDNEEVVGRVLTASGISRRNIFFTTKVCHPTLRPMPFEHLSTKVSSACKRIT